MILIKSLILILLMLILAQLYKYFNNDNIDKEGFSEMDQTPTDMPGTDTPQIGIPETDIPKPVTPETVMTTMQERAVMQGPITEKPTAALQVSGAKQSADFKKSDEPEPPLVPMKKTDKVTEAMENMKKDIQTNPLTEEVRLKFAELEKLGKEAVAIFDKKTKK
jgi:hypothetical protein